MPTTYDSFIDQPDEDEPLLGDSGPNSNSEPPNSDQPSAGPSTIPPPAVDVDDQDIPEHEPPPYRDTFKLIASTPSLSRRYEKSPLSELPAHVNIQAGLFASVAAPIQPAPEGWVEFIHPEGQNYFYSPARRIVTECNIRNVSTLQLIVRAAGQVVNLLAASQVPLPNSSELMLELEPLDNPEEPACKYYFVDHIRRAVFWLEHTTTSGLSLPPVTSVTHLKMLMVQHYWNHVEFFPMHITLPTSVEEELIGILNHAAIDYMTSDLSTVPYNPEQCDIFIKRLQSIPESQRVDGYRNCIMARIYAEVTGNYFVNLHGETNSRLSRNQRLLPPPDVQTPFLIKLVFKLGFGAGMAYYARLEDLWVDKIGYMSHWRVFMKSMIKEWKQISQWGLMLLLTSFSIFAVSLRLDQKEQKTSPVLSAMVQMTSLLSVLFCILSICSGLLLLRNHSRLAEAHATDAVDFLDRACHPAYGLQPLAIMFAFPWTSLLWAITLFVISMGLFSFTIPFLPVQILIWSAMIIGLSIGYFLVLFMSNGASALSPENIRAIFEIPDNRITRVVIKRPMAIIRATGRFAWRRLDATIVVIYKWLRNVRHDGRSARTELREP